MPLFASRPLVPFALGAVALAMLSACGGGSDDAAPAADAPPVTSSPPPATASSLSGTAAVGAPITAGKLRVLDATGTVVASDITINADGTYEVPTLTGTAPWRIEACGYAGANYGCIYSVAQAAGTANVTPLTSALITLASGLSPESIMADGASAPSANALGAAQSRLQTSLAATLADAGVSATLDFTTGSLAAGTRSGYDRLLDVVNVTTGDDNGAFVQVTPRLGDGNLYLTRATTTGEIVPAAGAAELPLGSLETLFNKMTTAIASASACSDANTGLATIMASDARMQGLFGGANVAAGLCQFFGNGDGGSGAIWGARFISPTLGKCDLTGTSPLCNVSFALQYTDGSVETVGQGMGVVYRDSRWQFYGSLLPVEISASAAVQRSVRVDDSTTPMQYSRNFQFDIQRTDGVACAVIKAQDDTTVAIYKVYEPDADRMSLWTTDGMSNTASTDPAAGSLRGRDDTWIQLPQGSAGDDVIRRFYRAGRTVNVSLYADDACTTPAAVDGKTVLAVDIAGMPPVETALPGLAWGTLTADTVTALGALALDAGTPGSFTGAWTFPNGVTGFEEAIFCSNGSCGDGGDARLGYTRVRPGTNSSVLSLHAPASPVAADSFKMFTLSGRDASGMKIESAFFSCTGSPAGQMCGQGTPPPPQAPAATHRRAR